MKWSPVSISQGLQQNPKYLQQNHCTGNRCCLTVCDHHLNYVNSEGKSRISLVICMQHCLVAKKMKVNRRNRSSIYVCRKTWPLVMSLWNIFSLSISSQGGSVWLVRTPSHVWNTNHSLTWLYWLFW